MFIYSEREKESKWGRGKKKRERENPKQAPCSQHRAQCRAWTHEPWDHDLSWSQPFSHLNHPCAPGLNNLKCITYLCPNNLVAVRKNTRALDNKKMFTSILNNHSYWLTDGCACQVLHRFSNLGARENTHHPLFAFHRDFYVALAFYQSTCWKPIFTKVRRSQTEWS